MHEILVATVPKQVRFNWLVLDLLPPKLSHDVNTGDKYVIEIIGLAIKICYSIFTHEVHTCIHIRTYMVTSIDVLPPKNQALCQLYVHTHINAYIRTYLPHIKYQYL